MKVKSCLVSKDIFFSVKKFFFLLLIHMLIKYVCTEQKETINTFRPYFPIFSHISVYWVILSTRYISQN